MKPKASKSNDRTPAKQASRVHPIPSAGVVIPSRADITAAVAAGPGITIVSLAKHLSVAEEAREAFARRLDAMLRDGELLMKAGARLAPGAARVTETGRVSRHRDGFGFITPDTGGDDLYVPAHSLADVMHGDLVAFVRQGFDQRGRQEARVVEVRERALRLVVGRMVRDGARWRVTTQDRNFATPVLLEPGTRGKEGDFVSVEITRYPQGGREAEGRIDELLGADDDSGIEIEVALRKHDLPHVFSPAALAEADKLPSVVRARDSAGRRDLRDLPLVTIDGEDARDFDDAVYCAPVRNWMGRAGRSLRLVVAIADVSHYVKPGTPLDADARERSTSVYFPRRVIPMLPEKISNGLCSLNPALDRLVLVCDMIVTPTGDIGSYEFYPGVMHSRARMTYTEVAQILAEPKGEAAARHDEIVPHLKNLHKVYNTLLGARSKRGAVDFESTETRMIFNEAGRIEKIVPVVRNQAHRLVEECMLAANVCAADILERHKHAGLYRVHAGPTPAKLENLRAFLGPLSLSLGGGEAPHALDYARLANQVRGRVDAGLISSVMLRSMQQAQYSPDNIGHFGLAYEKYAHFTSPIRRYPDLLTHRAIKAIIKRHVYSEDDWDALGSACSRAERRADEASREVQNWLKCRYAAEHLGEHFEGSISGVAGFGIFVTLGELLIDGMIHVSELGRDYYVYDEARHQLRGERSGASYALGQRVTVKIVRADPDALKIDLALVQVRHDAGAAPKRGGNGVPDGGARGATFGAETGEPGRGKLSRTAAPATRTRKRAPK